jgi:TPR repeat protein
MQDQDTGIKWIKHAANANHKCAQSMISEIYKKGDSIEQDYYKAALWFKRLAKQKDAAAQCNVGVMYKEGLGVRKDSLEASKWFIWAAEQGDSNAQFYLSLFRYNDAALREDMKECLYWLNKSVCQRNIKVCYTFSDLGSKGYFHFNKEHGIYENRTSGNRLLDFAATNGFMQAQLDMANTYQNRNGIPQDIQKRINYYEIAYVGDSGEAEFELAMIYLRVGSTLEDYPKEYYLMKQAKNKGYDMAIKLFVATPWDSEKRPYYSEIIDIFICATENGIDYSKATEWYLAASNNGDSRVDYRLGMMYEYGEGADINLDKAIYYYERASLKENTDANYRLACFYLEGFGVTQDLLKAFSYFTKASILGHERASDELIICKDYNGIRLYNKYSNGGRIHIDINEKTKVSMIEKATEEGYTLLQYHTGVWYESENDDSSAFKWLSRAATIGVTDAYYRIGVLYEEGRGAEQDYRMAANMYHKATEKEHEDACYRLGRLYQHGNGVDLNFLKAYQFYKKAQEMGQAEAHKVLNITLETTLASTGGVKEKFMDSLSEEYQDSLSMCKCVAKLGDTEIQFQVGFAYEYIVLEPDYVQAFNWYSMAADDSHREAIYYLGLLYEKGLGIPQNYQKAIQLYNDAGQLGSDKALHQLGVAYHDGNGVDIDPRKAIEYYTLSANLGNPEYQYFLGGLYEEGQLVQKDPQEALKWYTKAYLQGYDDVSSNLYAIYDDKPYEDFFFTKLFRNLSIASCGHFRLNDEYNHTEYYDLNMRLATFCALGYGTEKNFGQAWEYMNKDSHNLIDVTVSNFFSHQNDLSVSEKSVILK